MFRLSLARALGASPVFSNSTSTRLNIAVLAPIAKAPATARPLPCTPGLYA